MDTSERQIKRIVLDRMERCSVCHRGFEPDDVHVLSRKSDMWMLMVSCGECNARNFVAAVIGDGDAEEAQLALRRSEKSMFDRVLARSTKSTALSRTRSRSMTCSICTHFCKSSTGISAPSFATNSNRMTRLVRVLNSSKITR